MNFFISDSPTQDLEIVRIGLPPLIGNTFSLICNVTTDEDVLSGLSVGWFNNSSPVMNTTTRTILSQTGTSFKTVTLIFEPAEMGDEGNYTCISTLTIPGSHEPPVTVSDTVGVGIVGTLCWTSSVKKTIDNILQQFY